jgi:hypothetical protein
MSKCAAAYCVRLEKAGPHTFEYVRYEDRLMNDKKFFSGVGLVLIR